MAGFTAARLWPPPTMGLLATAIPAVAAGLLALWFAGKSGPRSHNAWRASLCLAVGLGGFVLFHIRQPHWHEWSNRPPREITVSVDIGQVFPPAPQARSISGLGTIVAARALEQHLVGRTVYFSAIRKLSVPARRTGRYIIRGVLEPLPHEQATLTFDAHLESLGIRLKLSRAQILREAVAPGWFQQFCGRTERRLEGILHYGLGRHPVVDSLYPAMLLGEKAVLSADQRNAFMRSGTFHIFSVSGLHVGVIALAFNNLLLLMRVPRRSAAAISLAVLWLYVQVTGGSSPAVRAFLMIASLLVQQVFRLPGNALAALTAAALVTLLLEPAQLFSTGFQMSYTVVVALVVMGVPLGEKWLLRWRPFALLPRTDRRWWHDAVNWTGRQVIGSGAACWTAFLASTPSSIGYFQLLSPGSLIANLVAIPVSSLAIVGGFLSLLCGLAGLLPWCALFNSAAAVTIIALDWLVGHGTILPGVFLPAHFNHSWMTPVAMAALLGTMLAGLAGRWSRRYGGYWPPALLVTLILAFWTQFG